jgi:hypothetical protein
MTSVQCNPAHQAAMAAKDAEKRQRNASALATGFWAGLVVGAIATVGLVVTYLISHAG